MQTQTCGNVVFHCFDPVTVQLSLDRSNVQHEKLVFKLVKPYIENFSLPSLTDSKHTEHMEVTADEPVDVEESFVSKETKELKDTKGRKKKKMKTK